MVKRMQKKMPKTGSIEKLIAENKKLKMEKKAIKGELEAAVRIEATEKAKREAEKAANDKEMSDFRRVRDNVLESMENIKKEFRAVVPLITTLKETERVLKEKLARQEMEHKNEMTSFMEELERFLARNQHMFARTTHILNGIASTSQKGIEMAQLFVASRDTGDVETCNNVLKKAEGVLQEFENIGRESQDIGNILNASPVQTCQKCDDKERKESQNTVPSTPLCQICAFEFSDVPGRIPRLLRCGHTLCEGCAQQIQQESIVKCPFDRKETRVVPGRCSYLPMNFTVMEVIEKGVKPIEK